MIVFRDGGKEGIEGGEDERCGKISRKGAESAKGNG
jgi:hypothetical protein